jgi:hypothetical protein
MSGYGLRRFAALLEEPVHLDNDGFLALITPNRLVSVLKLPLLSRNFALLAAGGAGKTTTTAALAAVEPDADYVETPLETRHTIETMISDTASSNSTLYFDAVDETATRDPVFMRWLGRALTKRGSAGFWRLSCRATSWDPALVSGLPDFKTWKLLPLDRTTAAAVVEEVVDAADFNGSAFIEAVAGAGLGRLSGCVSQLIAVARFWHGRGVLPETATDAMEYEVAHLLRETNANRPRDLPADRAMRIARRMAAFETFTGTQAFAGAATTVPGTLIVHHLPSESEPSETNRAIEPGDYRDVLDTALFGTGPAGAVVFQHQSYVEYLTAAYLVERKLQPGQVPALLGVHSNGLLPTSRLGTAAWLGALKPTLVQDLIHANVAMFVSAAAATELPSDAIREAVVTALLDHVARGEIGTIWKVDPALLIYPSLETELMRSMTALQLPHQLWWIARLAAAGQCTGLTAALAEAAADTQWAPFARRACAFAVSELGDDDIRRRLANLLDLGDDADYEVRAAVLDVLYPKLMSTQVLVAALRPAPRFGGSYRRVLGELADRVPPTDLPVVLDWMGTLDNPPVHGYEGLVDKLAQRAWDERDDVDVRRALARLLSADSWHQLSWGAHGFPWLQADADDRRNLALEMTGLGEDHWQAIRWTGLLRPDDMDWILDVVTTCAPTSAASLVACLATMLPGEIGAPLADRVLSLKPGHPAYEATRFLRDPVSLSGDFAQLNLERAAVARRVAERRVQLKAQARADFKDALVSVEADLGSWWWLPALIRQTAEGVVGAPVGHDLTTWPGWDELEPGDVSTLIDSGVQYLGVRTPEPATWVHLTSWTIEQVLPDWAGVYLLATLVRHYPDRLDDVSMEVWQRWLSAIVAVPVYGDEEPGNLRDTLLDAVPLELRPSLVDEAMSHVSVLHSAGSPLSPRHVFERLLPELEERVTAWLIAVAETSPVAEELLALVVESGAEHIALDLCRRIRSEPDSPLATQATRSLAGLDPNSAVDDLAGADDHTFSKVVAVANSLKAARLDHDHVLIAARLLLDTFPFDGEPPMQDGAVRPEDEARLLRTDLLRQLASTGRVDDLTELLSDRGDVDRQVIGRFLATARTSQADAAVKTISPKALLELLRSADARLVRDDGDFAAVLLHQLDNIQRQLLHSTAFREIWDGTVPQSEDSITDWLQRRLLELLTEGIVVDREVQVKREKPRGVGTRIDCVATTITETRSSVRVLFEAKLANNSEVATAMREQLIERYLVPQGRRHGILLIYWIHPDRRPRQNWSKAVYPEKDALYAVLRAQADAELEEGYHIAPVILDITPPAGFAGKDS